MVDAFEKAQSVSDLAAMGIHRGTTRSAQWVHPFRGVARPRETAQEDPHVRICDAAALLQDGCFLGGWASAYEQGVRYLDGLVGDHRLPVVVHAPHDRRIRHRPGLRVVRRRVHADELVEFDGMRMTSLARALYDEALDAPSLERAVVALDMGLSTTTQHARTTPGNLAKVFESHHKTRGIVRARQAFEMAVTRSASPLESRTRHLARVEAGLRDWLVNVPVFDLDEHLLGIADLLDAAAGLVVESDGGTHRAIVSHADDNVREERFERSGLVVCRVSSHDHTRKGHTVARLRAAYEDARHVTRRAWTLDKPSWWYAWPPGRRWD